MLKISYGNMGIGIKLLLSDLVLLRQLDLTCSRRDFISLLYAANSSDRGN